MLTTDPAPWLTKQSGLPALRARRALGLRREGDEAAARRARDAFQQEQRADGSMDQSPMRTAGVLLALADLDVLDESRALVSGAVGFLFSVLQAQPGYQRAVSIAPGSLRTPCDLGGFFGPYEVRGEPQRMDYGAQEMNYIRAFDPLFGPASPVRPERRSSLDRAGPSSCYAWGLIPLTAIVSALCRAGYDHDERLDPATRALLGAQRESGGWCRNLGGAPACSLHGVRALGVHPELRHSPYAERTLEFVRKIQTAGAGGWRGRSLFALLQAVATYDHPTARCILEDALAAAAPRQNKNGSFGRPDPVERVAAVLAARRTLVIDHGIEGGNWA